MISIVEGNSDAIYWSCMSEYMTEEGYLRDHILQKGHHTFHVRLLPVTGKRSCHLQL